MISLPSINDLNRIVVGNNRTRCFSNIPRIPKGNCTNPIFELPVLKWNINSNEITIIITNHSLEQRILEVCFFSYISVPDINSLRVILSDFDLLLNINTVRTLLPEKDLLRNALFDIGFSEEALYREHIYIGGGVYGNVSVLSYYYCSY